MPSDKFVRNDNANVFLVTGFNMGTAETDQGDGFAVVMNLLCEGKGAILVILPEHAYLDFLEHLGTAKAAIEDKRRRASERGEGPVLKAIEGGKLGTE